MAFDATTVRRDYGDPELEAYACRTDCALFDYAFIGRARLDGPGALDAIGELTRRPLPARYPDESATRCERIRAATCSRI